MGSKQVTFWIACSAFFGLPALADDCIPLDVFAIPITLDGNTPEIASVLLAYPSVRFDDASKVLIDRDGNQYQPSGVSEVSADELLQNASYADQFRFIYPLDFDLERRSEAWFDPGRVRDDAFFKFLYFENEGAARESLVPVVSNSHGTVFNVTTKHGVACQLSAVLDQIGATHPEVFQDVGGSFNWRRIAGTERLSVHSFGAAIDLNSSLGGYWRWADQSAGNVGPYRNRIPQDVVEAFERFGFIWGGKWHHYDGMHFEYRPELIIFSRITQHYN